MIATQMQNPVRDHKFPLSPGIVLMRHPDMQGLGSRYKVHGAREGDMKSATKVPDRPIYVT
jgi:hypothetical protein